MPDVPAPPTERWLHPAVNVRPSRIEGRGLIATADLAEGTVVARLGGRRGGVRRPITVLEGVHLVLPPRRPDPKERYGGH